jgi:hypothetical protein
VDVSRRFKTTRSYSAVTNIRDVIRQVEAVMFDIDHPPTHEEREKYARILRTVYTGAVDARGSK